MTASETVATGASVLEIQGLHAGYGSMVVARDIDLHVAAGEVVALLGPNGAGKTTTLMTVAGALRPIAGRILIDGKPAKEPMYRRARNGLAIVTEGRGVLMRATVLQNLALAKVDPERATALFPALTEILTRRTGDLSGGQQQMVALARALGSNPSLLVADELSLGLAPLAVDSLLAAVRQAADRGVGVLVVEQHVQKILQIADRVVILRRGRVQVTCSAAELRLDPEPLRQAYLG